MKKLALISIIAFLFFPNLMQSQCAPYYPGYITVGQYNGHNYYLSTTDMRPTDAQAAAEALGGYLAVIDDADEDDFIGNYIDELTYIGLNDSNTEGTFEWLNGDPVTYTNINPCGFCTENSEDQDYVVKEPWNSGGWSFSNFWNARKYMVEIPCGTSNTDCAFSNVWDQSNFFYNSSSGATRFLENANGYELRFEGFGVGTRRMTKWFLSTDGQTISTSDVEIPYPTGWEFGRFSVLGDYYFMHINEGNDVKLLKVDFSGSTVFEKTYNVNTTILNITYTTSRDGWEDADGILITGHTGNGPNGLRQPFLIKTDLDGNEMWQQLLPTENSFTSLTVLGRADDGGYYLRRGVGEEKIIKIDSNGNIEWTHEVIGDNTTTTQRRFFGESSDGLAFYYLYNFGFIADDLFLVKINASDGTFAWEKNVGNLFSLNNPASTFYNQHASVDNAGGVLITFSWQTQLSNGQFTDFGNKNGVIDADGNLVWGHSAPLYLGNFRRENFATSDGGYLFSGGVSNDRKYVFKTASNGSDAPICDDGGGGDLLVDCDLNIDPNDLNVEASDPTGTIVDWTPPTATTDCPDGGITIEQISGESSGSYFSAWTGEHIIVYRITDACGNEEICVTEFEVSGIAGGIICPADIVVDATSASGAIVNFGTPTILPTTCIPGVPNQVSGPPSGSVFPVGTTEIQFVSFFGGSNTYCQNGMSCTFNITVNPLGGGGGCPGEINGFTTIGEFGDSKYYVSNDAMRAEDAQVIAESNGGYLAAISSQEENDFIQQGISEMTYIGLNDYNSEGNLEWFNGEVLTYNNVNPCGFCNENSDDQDFVIMAPWDGAWSFSNFWNSRKYVMEIPCGGSTGGGGDCAFITKVSGNSSELEMVKTNDGYQAQILYSSFLIDYEEVNLNENGVVTSIDNVAPDMPNSSTYFKDENFYVTFPMLDGLSFDLSAFEIDGTAKWTSTFNINPIDPDADQLSVRMLDVGDGILGFGFYHYGNSANWRRFVIKIDYDGNEIFQNNLDAVIDFPITSGFQAAADGGLYYTRRSSGATGYFGRITGNGDLAWENNIIGDLVTNKIYLVGETPDAQSVYLSVADNNNYRAYIRKYNVITGDEISEVDLNNVFSPDRMGTTFGYRGAAVTPDGGIIAAISYSEIPPTGKAGTEYGRLDSDGNLMWWHDAPVGLGGMVANAALADGSLFFTKNNSGNSVTIIRMNEDGTFDPACDNGDLPDLELDNLIFFTSTLEVGQVYNAEFEIHNNGLATAAGDYEVALYIQEYDFSNPNPTEYFINSYSYSNTEFGLFETSVDFIPPNIPEGLYKLKLVIDNDGDINESDENNNIIIQSGVFTLENNGGSNLPDLTISNLTNFPSSTEVGEVVFFNFNLNNVGTASADGDYFIQMYISTDNTLSIDDILTGQVATGDTPVGTIEDVPGAITVPSLQDGGYYIIIVADDLLQITESDETNNAFAAPFEITSGGGGGCPTSLPGYTSLGEFNGSAYFLSDNIARPVDGQAAAEALGGNLATIDSQAENDFLYPQIGELAYIGLNDYDIENNLQWFSGDDVNYTNFDVCGFCNGNSDNMDFVVMHSWNGGWSWSNFYNNRKYIVEIACTTTVTDPNINNALIFQSPTVSENVSLLAIALEKVYPNPTEQFVFATVQSQQEQTVELQIFDARGSLKLMKTVDLINGENVIELSVADFPAGFYTILIPQAQGNHSTQRFMKLGK